MTQKEKELLLKDLSARLPYNVVIRCTDNDTDYKCLLTTDILNELLHNIEYYDYKPYLRPMSSMTEEEENEWSKLQEDPLLENVLERHTREDSLKLIAQSGYDSVDWLIKNHFDFRGLIPMGLALEAPDGMYKNE